MAGAAHCFAQTNALFRKNLVIQRRTNCCLISFPVLICLLFLVAQHLTTTINVKGKGHGCGYCAASTDPSFAKDTLGGLDCDARCPLPKWPPLLLLSRDSDSEPGNKDGHTNLQESSIRGLTSSPATFLVTGSNQSFAERVTRNAFPKLDSPNFAADISTLADFALGVNVNTITDLASRGADELGSYLDRDLYFLQSSCTVNSTLSFPVQAGSSNFTKDAECTEGSFLWLKNLSVMNNELYRGYFQEDNDTSIQIVSAYDFTRSDFNKFNLILSYDPTFKGLDHIPILLIPLPPLLLGVPRLLNLVSNAYLQLRGNDTKMRFEFVKDMPRGPAISSRLKVSSLKRTFTVHHTTSNERYYRSFSVT